MGLVNMDRENKKDVSELERVAEFELARNFLKCDSDLWRGK